MEPGSWVEVTLVSCREQHSQSCISYCTNRTIKIINGYYSIRFHTEGYPRTELRIFLNLTLEECNFQKFFYGHAPGCLSSKLQALLKKFV